MHTLCHAPPAVGGRHGGVPPGCQPRFSGKHVRQARLTAKQRNAPHSQVQRARLVLLLYRRPSMSSPEGARQLGQSPAWVYHWRRVWAAEGFRLDDLRRSGRPRVYSATDRAVVIAVACELPSQRDLPLSRHFASSIREVVASEGIPMSLHTVQRVLAENSRKPWRYQSWIHPRDPHFKEKAEVILGLYERVWKGRRLGPEDQRGLRSVGPEAGYGGRHLPCGQGRRRLARIASGRPRTRSPRPGTRMPREARCQIGTEMALHGTTYDAILVPMNLNLYVEEIHRQLVTAAEAGSDDARTLAERLVAPLESAVRLALQDALSAAADEITCELAPGTVELRLRGRDPEFVVTLPPADLPEESAELAPLDWASGPIDLGAPPAGEGDEGGMSRINLRLPDQLKSRIGAAASGEGLSVNAWLVRAAAAALQRTELPRPSQPRMHVGAQRYTGWAR